MSTAFIILDQAKLSSSAILQLINGRKPHGEKSIIIMRLPVWKPDSKIVAEERRQAYTGGDTSYAAEGFGQVSNINVVIIVPFVAICCAMVLLILGILILKKSRRTENQQRSAGEVPTRPQTHSEKNTRALLSRALLTAIPIITFDGDQKSDWIFKRPETVVVHHEAIKVHTESSGKESEGSPSILTADSQTTKLPHLTSSTTGQHIKPTSENCSNCITLTSSQQTPWKRVSLRCSICNEDFEHGQDVPLLPCNHGYHPACVDPWLLDRSATCPLWCA